MSDPALHEDRMTFEQAARLDPDEHPGEIDKGRWLPVTKNTWKHGEVAGNAYTILRNYARKHHGWSVSVGDPGTKLAGDPDTLRGPDVGMVHKDRKPTGKGAEGWLQGAPDIVVEVIGDSQSHAELAKKALEFLAAGASMVWVLDVDAEKLILYTPPNQIRVLTAQETMTGGDILPGFSCLVAEFFELIG
jgi:Uma2 family endonuclease